MNKNLVNFKGLFGDNKQLSLNDFIYSEALEIRSKLYDWEITEHLHTDLVQIFIFTDGEGLLISENKKIALITPSVLFIPANTLHGFVFQSNISGDVLTFSDAFQEKTFNHFPQLILELNRLKQFEFEEDRTTFDELIQLQKRIEQELTKHKPEKSLALQALFQLLFVNLYRIGTCNTFGELLKFPERLQSDNRTLSYYQSFQKLIKQSLHDSKSIKKYAKELGITPVHLNRVCQTVAKKSALQIVQEYVINEAKKYILNSSYSIAEISYFLDFKDPAYFTRLFTKNTGVSPSAFRKSVEKSK